MGVRLGAEELEGMGVLGLRLGLGLTLGLALGLRWAVCMMCAGRAGTTNWGAEVEVGSVKEDDGEALGVVWALEASRSWETNVNGLIGYGVSVCTKRNKQKSETKIKG